MPGNHTFVIQIHLSLMFHYQNTMILIYFSLILYFQIESNRFRNSSESSNFGGSWEIFLDVNTARNPNMWTSSYVLCTNRSNSLHFAIQKLNSDKNKQNSSRTFERTLTEKVFKCASAHESIWKKLFFFLIFFCVLKFKSKSIFNRSVDAVCLRKIK